MLNALLAIFLVIFKLYALHFFVFLFFFIRAQTRTKLIFSYTPAPFLLIIGICHAKYLHHGSSVECRVWVNRGENPSGS